MKRTLFALIAAAFVLAGCSDSVVDSSPSLAADKAENAGKKVAEDSIVDLVLEFATADDYLATPDPTDGPVYAGEFDLLYTAVASAPAVLELLSSKGQYTVFAPTDDAFMHLMKALDPDFAGVEADAADVISSLPLSDLNNILAYHVANGRRYAADVISADQIRMLNGEFTTISEDGGSYFINESEIVGTDNEVSNGIVHVIDTVLIP